MSSRAVLRSPLLAPDLPLVDVHVNLGVSDAAGLSYGRLSVDEYLALMGPAGVHRAWAFPPLMGDYGAANAQLAERAAHSDGRLLAFARLGGRRGPRPLRELWQLRRTLRGALMPQPAAAGTVIDSFHGIKLMPHMSGLPAADSLAAIAERKLPVLVHAGVHCPPRWIVRTVLPRVGGPLILAHLGAYPCDEPLLREAVALAQRHEDVYLDTSGAWLASFVRYAVAKVPEKVLFGSDAPLAHPWVAWRHVMAAVPRDDWLELVGYANAGRIMPADDPAG